MYVAAFLKLWNEYFVDININENWSCFAHEIKHWKVAKNMQTNPQMLVAVKPF